MLGHAVMRVLTQVPDLSVAGTVRSEHALRLMPEYLRDQVVVGVDVTNPDCLTQLFGSVRPGVVINCVGLVKQLAQCEDPLVTIPINSLLPHRLAHLCNAAGARLIHVSTDCVFSGTKGMYRDDEPSDAKDLYGRSKYLGEVDYPWAVTLRTSIIGHELGSAHGLVGWFLGQSGPVKGYTRAIFSGFPTVEFARIVRDFVIPNPEIHGVHNVSSMAISKFDLLQLISSAYGRTTRIVPDDSVIIDRSLDSSRFCAVTGYSPPPWSELVRNMEEFR